MPPTFETWWYNNGPVTRNVIVAAVALSAATSFGYVSFDGISLDLTRTVVGLEVWRVLTSSLFFGQLGIGFFVELWMTIAVLGRLEEDSWRATHDIVWMLVLLVAGLHAILPVFGFPVVSFSLTAALLWVWCRRHKADVVRIVLPVTVGWLPVAALFFHFVAQRPILFDLCGFAVGHAFVYLKDVLPFTRGIRLVETPSAVRKIFAPS